MKLLICFGIGFLTLAYASPAVEKKALTFESDPIEFIKEYVVSFLDDFLSKDSHKVCLMLVKIKINFYQILPDFR